MFDCVTRLPVKLRVTVYQANGEVFELFIQKIFLHFYTTFNSASSLKIDYKDMALTLVKSKGLHLKESFGEDEKGSFLRYSLMTLSS